MNILITFNCLALRVNAHEDLDDVERLHPIRWQQYARVVFSLMEFLEEASHVGIDALSNLFITINIKQWHQALPLLSIACNLELDVFISASTEVKVYQLVELVGTIHICLHRNWRFLILVCRLLQALSFDLHHEVNV